MLCIKQNIPLFDVTMQTTTFKKIQGKGLWRPNLRDKFHQRMFVWDNVRVQHTNEFNLVAEGIEKELSLKYPIRIIGIVNAVTPKPPLRNRFDLFFLVHKFDEYRLMRNNRRTTLNIKTWECVLREQHVLYPNKFIHMYPPLCKM